MFLGHAWVGWFVALVAVVSGFGALIGWTLVTAEIARAASKDVLFPEVFGKTNRYHAARFGILVSTAVASLLMGWSDLDPTNPKDIGVKVFTRLVSLSVVTVAIPTSSRRAPSCRSCSPAPGRRVQRIVGRPHRDRVGPDCSVGPDGRL